MTVSPNGLFAKRITELESYTKRNMFAMEVVTLFSVACDIQYRSDNTFFYHNQEEMALQQLIAERQ